MEWLKLASVVTLAGVGSFYAAWGWRVWGIDKTWWLFIAPVVVGIPLGMVWTYYNYIALEILGGTIPARFVAFGVGTGLYFVMAKLCFDEPIATVKTGICLLACLVILLAQSLLD